MPQTIGVFPKEFARLRGHHGAAVRIIPSEWGFFRIALTCGERRRWPIQDREGQSRVRLPLAKRHRRVFGPNGLLCGCSSSVSP